MLKIIFLSDLKKAYDKLLLYGITTYFKNNPSFIIYKMPLSYKDRYGIEGIIKWAKEWKVDGIIGQFLKTDPVEKFKANGIIAIAQDFEEYFTEIPNIKSNHKHIGRIGVEYFINKGFKSFAFYGYEDLISSKERRLGFRENIKKQGLKKYIYEYHNKDFREYWFYDPALLIDWLRCIPKPLGIMARDDYQAQHIIEVCRIAKIKIPEEIAVLGVDNDLSVCSLSDPPLSSVNQSVKKGGYETANLLERLILNPETEYEDILIEPTYITTRESTDIYATQDDYVSIILRYIHQYSNKKINVDELTALVPLSRRLLENRFKNVTGLPIYNYLHKFRIDRFTKLLLETSDPIIEIASAMGFPDYKNFSRQFKSLKGCTPTEYRKYYSSKI